MMFRQIANGLAQTNQASHQQLEYMQILASDNSIAKQL